MDDESDSGAGVFAGGRRRLRALRLAGRADPARNGLEHLCDVDGLGDEGTKEVGGTL